jgi:Calcium binding
MIKSKKDPIREERIHNEVVVDAYGAEEQAMGWYYYLEDKIRFPFQAECVVAKVVSPLLKGETVEVQGMAPEEACSADMLVLIRGKAGAWRFPCLNYYPSRGTKRLTKPSRTGTIGWSKAIASEPPPASIPDLRPAKAHEHASN